MIRKRNRVLDWGSHSKLMVGAVVGGRMGRVSPTRYGLDLRGGNWLIPIAVSKAELFSRTSPSDPGGTSSEGRTLGFLSGLPVITVKKGMIAFL